jgi:hypothetical protein
VSVRLSGTLSAVITTGPDSPIEGVAANGPFPSLPQGDRFETQRAICQAIAQLLRNQQPEISQLGELFELERHAQPVCTLLLNQYVEGDGQLRSFDWKAWRAAMLLSESFFQAHEHFLHHIRNTSDAGWIEHEPLILLQLFHHRKTEFLLRLLRYKKRSSGQWRQLHEMYRCSLERDVQKRADGVGEIAHVGERPLAGKLAQQYLQILLLEAMNTGQFSPREALWAHRWFARWCTSPALQLTQVSGGFESEGKGFVVDLDGSDGLKRAPGTAGNFLYLDSSPLLLLIEEEMASLTDGADLPQRVTPAERAGQWALLNKLAILFAPKQVSIERRAERKPIALTVQAIAGFSCIVEELRRNAQTRSGRGSFAAAPGSGNTISPFDGPTFSPLFAAGGNAGQAIFSITDQLSWIPQIWQVKDRSDTGCRMRGQIDNMNRVIPGSLIGIRDSETAPWTVSVVRWFRRLMVDHVEIGVEYLGRKPRLIKLVADHDRDVATDKLPQSTSRCFAALYLPPSEQHPTLPIKTLLLPASEFRAGCEVTLLSSTATYRMRLNEAIQKQFEFVLTSFSVIDKVAPPHSGT